MQAQIFALGAITIFVKNIKKASSGMFTLLVSQLNELSQIHQGPFFRGSADAEAQKGIFEVLYSLEFVLPKISPNLEIKMFGFILLNSNLEKNLEI